MFSFSIIVVYPNLRWICVGFAVEAMLMRGEPVLKMLLVCVCSFPIAAAAYPATVTGMSRGW
jgi:hypothetical protein